MHSIYNTQYIIIRR